MANTIADDSFSEWSRENILYPNFRFVLQMIFIYYKQKESDLFVSIGNESLQN